MIHFEGTACMHACMRETVIRIYITVFCCSNMSKCVHYNTSESCTMSISYASVLLCGNHRWQRIKLYIYLYHSLVPSLKVRLYSSPIASYHSCHYYINSWSLPQLLKFQRAIASCRLAIVAGTYNRSHNTMYSECYIIAT